MLVFPQEILFLSFSWIAMAASQKYLNKSLLSFLGEMMRANFVKGSDTNRTDMTGPYFL